MSNPNEEFIWESSVCHLPSEYIVEGVVDIQYSDNGLKSIIQSRIKYKDSQSFISASTISMKTNDQIYIRDIFNVYLISMWIYFCICRPILKKK